MPISWYIVVAVVLLPLLALVRATIELAEAKVAVRCDQTHLAPGDNDRRRPKAERDRPRRQKPDRRPESADAATKTRRLVERRRAFVESQLTNASVPVQRAAGPRSFTVSPVRTFAPFASL